MPRSFAAAAEIYRRPISEHDEAGLAAWEAAEELILTRTPRNFHEARVVQSVAVECLGAGENDLALSALRKVLSWMEQQAGPTWAAA